MAMFSTKVSVSRGLISHFSFKSKTFTATPHCFRSIQTICLRTRDTSINLAIHAPRRKHYPVLAVASIRWSSQLSESQYLVVETKPSSVDGKTEAIATKSELLDEKASAVVLSDASSTADVASSMPTSSGSITDVAIDLVAGEPALSTYGLCGWSPVGLAQRGLEFIHITLDVPWWGSIVIGTIVLRTLVFPLVIKSQRNAAKMTNNMPEFMRLQQKMTEARQSGNQFEAARLGQEMMLFMKEKKMNPLSNVLPPLAQAPLFISMFMALRGMCNVPVESLRDGGILWFVDLTLPDQFYLLPVVTSLTLAATVELGVDSQRASQMGMMRYVLRALPILVFPFTINFPGAILCYWVSTNFISLLQVAVLKIPRVRTYFNIEPIIIHPAGAIGQKKGFIAGFKESMTNMKITRQLNEREHTDYARFQQAGRAPIIRTFKHDPTKPRAAATNEMLAKKKDH